MYKNNDDAICRKRDEEKEEKKMKNKIMAGVAGRYGSDNKCGLYK